MHTPKQSAFNKCLKKILHSAYNKYNLVKKGSGIVFKTIFGGNRIYCRSLGC